MTMDYLSHNVSENLKRIRQSKGMSLDQVAEQTGVSINTALGRMRYAILNLRRLSREHRVELTR